mmetsp:Transcript_18296/g.37068  ORF Transcript_18296/g.37068 Transcript_18296/m.37068 type:complete len:95 (-) Transcript_18296:190-474(-)
MEREEKVRLGGEDLDLEKKRGALRRVKASDGRRAGSRHAAIQVTDSRGMVEARSSPHSCSRSFSTRGSPLDPQNSRDLELQKKTAKEGAPECRK